MPALAMRPGDPRAVKKIAILPTLLTLGNGVCGFAAIHFASKVTRDAADRDAADALLISAALIFLAMLFDALDGYAARLSKSASEFGGQLDSLCDAISFGLAPAFLLLKLCLEWDKPPVNQAVAVIAALYLVCALLRLARFNLENSPDPTSHKRFKGLPSPAAAGCVASLALLQAELAANWAGLDELAVRHFVKVYAPLGTLLVALLMVSRLPYPHFTNQLLRGRRHFSFVVQLVLLVFVIALQRDVALFIVFWAYAFSAPVRYLLVRGFRRGLTPRRGLDEALPH